MAIILVTILLSILLVLALIAAGDMTEPEIIHYDTSARGPIPSLFGDEAYVRYFGRYDRTRIEVPSDWKPLGNYAKSLFPGVWEADGYPTTYKFTNGATEIVLVRNYNKLVYYDELTLDKENILHEEKEEEFI